ncbi:hypothetical protein AYO44_02055 [Planctomycetaceae bacterium SCGC AG-212-F19]|nr:hypothetical protein AYO44_02055 [Planctomycetaceae bacterium SCGC AG-212-F19]
MPSMMFPHRSSPGWFSLKDRWGPFVRRLRRYLWLAPRLQTAQVGYTKEGLRVANQAIAWNADGIFVELVLETGPWCAGAKSDFQLVNADGIVAGANRCELDGPDGQLRVEFKFLPLQSASPIGICYRGYWLGYIEIPILTKDSFLAGLQLEALTVFTRLEGRYVPCQLIVEGQSEGLMFGAVLRSPTSLLPLLEREISVELVGPDGSTEERSAVPLAGFQLGSLQALLSGTIAACPRATGTWQVRWRVADFVLATTTFQVIRLNELLQSLYVICDGLPQWENETAAERGDACGFRFSVASQVPGVAARCPVEVHLYYKDGTVALGAARAQLLVSDVASLGTALTVVIEHADRVQEFGVCSQGWFLGSVCRQSAPIATFTSEGGFHSLPDCAWTPVMDAELNDQLNKLMHCSKG